MGYSIEAIGVFRCASVLDISRTARWLCREVWAAILPDSCDSPRRVSHCEFHIHHSDDATIRLSGMPPSVVLGRQLTTERTNIFKFVMEFVQHIPEYLVDLCRPVSF